MFHFYQQLTYFNLLCEQHRYHTNVLSSSHRALGNQYRRLAELELAIAKRHETHMTRKEKKHLQWARWITKKAIQDLERQQVWLREHLRQCEALINSCAHTTDKAATGWWTGNSPPVPYPMSPLSPMPIVPRTFESEDVGQQPKYCDLSMLRESRGSCASIPSADSGFHEPPAFAQPPQCTLDNTGSRGFDSSLISQPRQNSFQSKKDSVAELGMPTSVGAELRRPRRRYSENAIQIIESRLATPKAHNRVRSVEQIPVFDRVGLEVRPIRTYSEVGLNTVC